MKPELEKLPLKLLEYFEDQREPMKLPIYQTLISQNKRRHLKSILPNGKKSIRED